MSLQPDCMYIYIYIYIYLLFRKSDSYVISMFLTNNSTLEENNYFRIFWILVSAYTKAVDVCSSVSWSRCPATETSCAGETLAKQNSITAHRSTTNTE